MTIKVNGEDNTEMHMDALTIKATTTNTVGNEVSATPNLTNVETATTTAVAVTNYNGESNINLEDESACIRIIESVVAVAERT